MKGKERKMFPLPTPSDATPAGGSVGNHIPPNESDRFYIKLTHLLESTGLTLIVNVRETLLDLYEFYLEVTRRGGFRQVGREKKWGEVVSALKLDGNNANLSDQVEKLYANVLYQFEQLYFYRVRATQADAANKTEGPLKRKWSTLASLSPVMNVQDGYMVTKMCKDHPCQTTAFGFQAQRRAGFVEQTVVLPAVATSNGRKKNKRAGIPRGRSGYQIFLNQECARLKTSGHVLRGTAGRTMIRMAIDAWNKMSDTEQQPYVEESKKNKEKLKEAMITPSKQQNTMQEKRPSVCGDCRVTLQPVAHNSRDSTPAFDLAPKMTEKAPKIEESLTIHSLGLATEKFK
ncbi:putative transcription factor & chromatin remodeling ARID-HMG family [Lupinus albus]|uniref:Putative transcription factor & chromatin remodeling ARID-HMG family n=1 Tax=Lupinus albus TaxID=3870 RepID=A0A6A4QE74_LUPAL|nr:putative transcription factor & chromatin remodeling ARID-HMG family [Lupinus albus]